MSLRMNSLLVLMIALSPGVVVAGTPTLVELTLGDDVHQGTSLWHNDDVCVLQRLDGSLVNVSLVDVTAFRQVSPRYRPMSVTELRRELRQEFRHLQVEAAGNSIVVAPSGMARDLAELHHDTWSVYQDYFRRRDFDVSRTEMPFVTVVYPTVEEFVEVAELHRVPVSPTMKGYYHAISNRIIMFVPPAVTLSTEPEGLQLTDGVHANIDDVDLLQTLAHEAVHQFGFNTGLHRRVGDNPRWVVEGLAMQFEGEAGLASNTSTRQQRMNRDRFVWYVQGVLPQQSPELLASLLTGDEFFYVAVHDAYAMSWALSFFLMETKRAQFVEYLQTQGSVPLDQRLDGPHAIDAFEDAFGDLDNVNDSLVRFMRSLNR